jgi:hypothetical protein
MASLNRTNRRVAEQLLADHPDLIERFTDTAQGKDLT